MIDDSKHLLIYDKNDRNVKTYAGTPERDDMHKHSTMRNSIDEGAGDRLESIGLDNQDLQQRPSKQVNITNQINKTYIVQRGGNGQRGQSGAN